MNTKSKLCARALDTVEHRVMLIGFTDTFIFKTIDIPKILGKRIIGIIKFFSVEHKNSAST